MSSEVAVRIDREGLYRGWWVLAATFVCAMLVIGSTNYAFQLFVVPLERELGLSRAAVNQGMSLFLVGCAFWSPLAGRALDRLPAPLVMSGGGIAIGLAMMAIASTDALPWMAAAIVGPLAAGAVCAGGLANTTVVSRWFRRRRGRALGIATVSSGAGGFVMVQLIGRWIERSGWREGLFWTGVLLAGAITALALLVVRSRPDDAMLARAGELDEDAPPSVAPGAKPAANGTAPRDASARDGRRADDAIWTLRALVATRNFWCIALGAGLLMASDGALLVSKVPYLLEIGIDLPHASFLVGCMTASSVVGKLGIGLAADRVDLRRLFGAIAACHVCLLLVLIARPGYATLLVAVSLFGVGIGGVYPMLATLTASTFGSASFGSVSGAMQLVLHPISIALLTFIGATHDRTGSYRLAFQAFIGLVFVATTLVFLIELPARRPSDAREVSA